MVCTSKEIVLSLFFFLSFIFFFICIYDIVHSTWYLLSAIDRCLYTWFLMCCVCSSTFRMLLCCWALETNKWATRNYILLRLLFFFFSLSSIWRVEKRQWRFHSIHRLKCNMCKHIFFFLDTYINVYLYRNL